MKKNVEKKLFSLMSGEFFALVMFAFLWILYINILDTFDAHLTSLENIYAFLLLEFILLQGSIYWYLKWSKVKHNKSYHLSHRQLHVFRWFRRINVLLLCIGLFIFLKNIGYSPITFNGFYLFLYCFALIEYINYYHLRLSYLTSQELKELLHQKGLRRSILARELCNMNN